VGLKQLQHNGDFLFNSSVTVVHGYSNDV